MASLQCENLILQINKEMKTLQRGMDFSSQRYVFCRIDHKDISIRDTEST